MKRKLLTLLMLVACSTAARGNGLLIPDEPDLPPLAMLNHQVTVKLEDQISVTKVRQTFRNHTSRKLEATYVFPVPRGASVREFSMWVNGRRVQGELLDASKAQSIYTSIIQQTRNPALLDYIGSDMLRMKIFPVPPGGDQQVEVSFTGIARRENDLVDYLYPLKSDRHAASTLEEFKLDVQITSQRPIANVYSPSHDISVSQPDDNHAQVKYERHGAQLDRDFQLYYTTGDDDIRLTTIEHRPIRDDDGYLLMLVSPSAELPKDQQVPRDIVFVVDSSGSMQGGKLEQAQHAFKHCLAGLSQRDRFGLLRFSTTVDSFRYELSPVAEKDIQKANRWVDKLYPRGGTAIAEALEAALDMRTEDQHRMFTVVFFTDGQPTIGERDPDAIITQIARQNSENTRIFSFGVGDDLNAMLLDQIAEQTRGVSQYVRPGQDLNQCVCSFFDKINRPVLANLKLSTSSAIQLTEVYPPQLPDLFYGEQLVVLARYEGTGDVQIRLDGTFGNQPQRFVYDIKLAGQTVEKPFVEELWARRKVGFLLDQIRIGGEQQELVDEVMRLAKEYGIATPYTSYLIMPDAPLPVVATANRRPGAASQPAALTLAGAGGRGARLEEFARQVQGEGQGLGKNRADLQDAVFEQAAQQEAGGSPAADQRLHDQIASARRLRGTLDLAQANYARGKFRANHVNALGVELAVSTNELKRTRQVQASAIKIVANRRCMELGGVWIDDGFRPEMPTLTVRAQGEAYFRMLARHPGLKDVFQLGNHVLWIAPNGTALVIEAERGQEQLSDREIDALFAGG